MRNPQRVVGRFTFLAVALFVAFVGVSGGWWLFYERPADRCERSGNWWDPEARICGTVVYIPDVTGRHVIEGETLEGPTADQLPAPPVRRSAAPSA